MPIGQLPGRLCRLPRHHHHKLSHHTVVFMLEQVTVVHIGQSRIDVIGKVHDLPHCNNRNHCLRCHNQVTVEFQKAGEDQRRPRGIKGYAQPVQGLKFTRGLAQKFCRMHGRSLDKHDGIARPE